MPEVLATETDRKKKIQVGKKDLKLSCIADGMIICTENPEVSTLKLLKLINWFSKLAGYKINIEKYVVYLYNNNKLSES